VIDHVSVGVRDLASATQFYEAVLGVLGSKKLVRSEFTTGFGKKYPEFWLNARPELEVPALDNGSHVCLRAESVELVDEFYALAISLGASSSGAPGLRPEYHSTYYACFIRDVDGNHFEVVTFLAS